MRTSESGTSLQMADYQRIVEAARFLENRKDPSDLTQVAAHLGVGPDVFQREFADWADAPGAEVLQCLKLSHVPEWLRMGQDALARDTNVVMEAAPREIVRGRGKGLRIEAGVAASPFGLCLLGWTEQGITHASFFDDDCRKSAFAEFESEWPAAEYVCNDAGAASLARRMFQRGTSVQTSWRLWLRGTPFQFRVWQAMLRIPAGGVATYGMLAAAAGHAGAYRATGAAVGANPIGFLLPCHRVLPSSGSCGAYHWGSLRKRVMLAWERAGIESQGRGGRHAAG